MQSYYIYTRRLIVHGALGKNNMTSINVADAIKNAADHVFAQLGPGFSEAAYRNAMQCSLPVTTETEVNRPVEIQTPDGTSVQVTTVRFDIVAAKTAIIELKATCKKMPHDRAARISQALRCQLMAYTRAMHPHETLLTAVQFWEDGFSVDHVYSKE